MGLRGPIVTATDLSDGSDGALQQASAIAADLGVRLVVCHVLPETFNARVLFPHRAGADLAVHTAVERKAQGATRARIDTVLGGMQTDVDVAIEWGSAHAGILERADRIDAGLIVVGPGATAARVSRAARCPVLVARPSPTGGGVLGATDFSDPALPAVHMAADEAARRNVSLRLVHCLDVEYPAHGGILVAPGMPEALAIPALTEEAVQALESAARDRLANARARTGRAGECVVLRGRPAAGILDAARAPVTALIVVGTRGRTGFARLALGSVAEEVMSRAACSVLMVPLRPAPADQDGTHAA